MDILNTLISEIETAKESEGNTDFIIDKDISQLLGDLYQVKKKTEDLARDLNARLQDAERHAAFVAEKDKKIGELEQSLINQHNTIRDQSETLNKREETVNDLQAQVATMHDAIKNHQQEYEDWKAQLDDLKPAFNFFEIPSALRAYAVRLAENARDNSTAQTAVHLLQLARTVEDIGDWERAHSFLVTGP